MKPKALFTGCRWLAGVLIICTGLGLLWLAQPAQAGPELPPREPPHKPPADSGDGVSGATIELQLPAAASFQYWTKVQWQDGNRNWHDVEGWQGRLADNGYQVWWVHPNDFGAGPFRWSVYQGHDGFPVAASEAFRLPTEANASVMVTVELTTPRIQPYQYPDRHLHCQFDPWQHREIFFHNQRMRPTFRPCPGQVYRP